MGNWVKSHVCYDTYTHSGHNVTWLWYAGAFPRPSEICELPQISSGSHSYRTCPRNYVSKTRRLETAVQSCSMPGLISSHCVSADILYITAWFADLRSTQWCHKSGREKVKKSKLTSPGPAVVVDWIKWLWNVAARVRPFQLDAVCGMKWYTAE